MRRGPGATLVAGAKQLLDDRPVGKTLAAWNAKEMGTATVPPRLDKKGCYCEPRMADRAVLKQMLWPRMPCAPTGPGTTPRLNCTLNSNCRQMPGHHAQSKPKAVCGSAAAHADSSAWKRDPHAGPHTTRQKWTRVYPDPVDQQVRSLAGHPVSIDYALPSIAHQLPSAGHHWILVHSPLPHGLHIQSFPDGEVRRVLSNHK